LTDRCEIISTFYLLNKFIICLFFPQKHTDERLKRIHDTLIGIKIIKLNAWDDVFLRKIQTARKKELIYLNKDSMYWTFMSGYR